MEKVDISGKIKNWIRFGLIIPLATSAAIGYGAFEKYHPAETLQIEDAKVTGTMVSVRTLVDGEVSEIVFNDGDMVQAGDVIARMEVSVTAEAIAQLENTVALAKQNYEDLKLGQIVTVPVKRLITIPAPYVPPTVEEYYAPSGVSSATLAALEERATRMDELFEMGAVSRVQRDAARAEYESALAESYSAPSYVQTSPGYQPEPTVIEEIEYIEEWQPTPPEALLNAENAIKQAELSLNVALQEAQETEVIAPVSGTIYYNIEMNGELSAGNTVARIGDSNELWLAAEVSEDTFNKIPLGKPVDYVLAGYNLSGTVIEKIAPVEIPEVEVVEEKSAWIAPTADNPHPEILTEPTDKWIAPTANNPHPEIVSEPSDKWIPPTAENAHPEIQSAVDEQATEIDEPAEDKYILRFSLPADRNFECKPNTSTTVSVKLF